MSRTTLSIGAICGLMFVLAVPTFAAFVEDSYLYQGQSDDYSIRLSEDVTYEIGVISDTYNCDLDLYVFDSDGDLVAIDNSRSSDAYVQYTPSRTQVVTIRVKAASGNAAYVLLLAP